MNKSSELKRVQINLTPTNVDRLKALQDKTQASSYSDVVNKALKAYAIIVKNLEGGNEIAVIDELTKETIVLNLSDIG